jgi:hypothetical protein
MKLLTLPEHLSSPPVLSVICVVWSLDFCIMFCTLLLAFCHFTFGHCIIYPSIYGFWLPLWYLHTFGHCIICPSLIYGFWLPPLVSSMFSYIAVSECMVYFFLIRDIDVMYHLVCSGVKHCLFVFYVSFVNYFNEVVYRPTLKITVYNF